MKIIANSPTVLYKMILKEHHKTYYPNMESYVYYSTLNKLKRINKYISGIGYAGGKDICYIIFKDDGYKSNIRIYLS